MHSSNVNFLLQGIFTWKKKVLYEIKNAWQKVKNAL